MACAPVSVSKETGFSLPWRCSTTTRIVSAIGFASLLDEFVTADDEPHAKRQVEEPAGDEHVNDGTGGAATRNHDERRGEDCDGTTANDDAALLKFPAFCHQGIVHAFARRRARQPRKKTTEPTITGAPAYSTMAKLPEIHAAG